MPKDRRSSSCRCRASPYSRHDKNDDRRTRKSPSLPIGNENEFEEARCPICMEHPHNAVLLLCSSHKKGCRPYMCDTSSRHSNCLDQFRKSTVNVGKQKQSKLVCPLCRGQINGWSVVNPARQFMNLKTRNCSLGTCDFTGNYSQLREHARRVHPCVRPTNVDHERELEWRSLEDDMEQQDMLSMQFEFDDDDDAAEFMNGVSDIASPMWDHDYSVFYGDIVSALENVLPEFESSSDDESEIREVGRSRGTLNRLLRRSRENARTGTARRVGQRSNSRPSSHNRQEQVTTLVEFHELSSNPP